MSVFISYRRDGGQQAAEAIYQNLCGEYNVFLDLQSLKNGFFDTPITETIENCTDFIIIITETVFDRCTEPNDWIFREAEIALREHKNIIPIFSGTHKFPANVPEQIKTISRYNGIFWSDEDVTYEKIKSFLVSNKRYRLTAVRSGDRIALSPESKEELKALYRKILKTGHRGTEIAIDVPDPKEISKLIIDRSVADEHGMSFAEKVAEQMVLSKISEIGDTLERAIEYMIRDEILEPFARGLRDRYLEQYGAPNCVFRDEGGLESFYWVPYLWFDIIEELFKELIIDRYEEYGNSRDFTPVDCYFKPRGQGEIWDFVSFVKKQPEDDSYNRFMHFLNLPFGRSDVYELPRYSRAFHVYPDFYYNLGKLKANKTVYPFEKISQYEGIFNLEYYMIGLH